MVVWRRNNQRNRGGKKKKEKKRARCNQKEVLRQEAVSWQPAGLLLNTSSYLFLDLLFLLCSLFQLGLQVTDLAQVPSRLAHREGEGVGEGRESESGG